MSALAGSRYLPPARGVSRDLAANVVGLALVAAMLSLSVAYVYALIVLPAPKFLWTCLALAVAWVVRHPLATLLVLFLGGIN